MQFLTNFLSCRHAAAPNLVFHPRCFCLIWLTLVPVLVMLVGAFNMAVDPYLVIGAPRIAGFNAVKPETETHTQLAKDYLLPRVRPVGLMLGDSKVDIGLDPDSAAWPEDVRPVFNYGIPGIGLAGSLAGLSRAAALGNLRRALVLVELSEFMMPAAQSSAIPVTAATSLFNLGVPSFGFGGIRQHATDLLLSTVSLDALRSSLVTLMEQARPNVFDLSFHGGTSEGGFRALVVRESYDALFVQKDVGNRAAQMHLMAALQEQPHADFNGFSELKALMELCQQRHIALDLVIAPFHADYLESLDQIGLWPRYLQAKLALTRLMTTKNDKAVRLWDFLGYDTYSTEPIPSVSDHQHIPAWFWEPNHFKQALGEKILATVYRGSTEYGVQLTADTITAHLIAETEAKIRFQENNTGSRERLVRATHPTK